jgi:hypothetical protein
MNEAAASKYIAGSIATRISKQHIFALNLGCIITLSYALEKTELQGYRILYVDVKEASATL